MVEEIFWRLVSLLILSIGTYICLHPVAVSKKIKVFYSTYPLTRLAGEKQLTSRIIFVRLFGVVIIILGILGLFHT